MLLLQRRRGERPLRPGVLATDKGRPGAQLPEPAPRLAVPAPPSPTPQLPPWYNGLQQLETG